MQSRGYLPQVIIGRSIRVQGGEAVYLGDPQSTFVTPSESVDKGPEIAEALANGDVVVLGAGIYSIRTRIPLPSDAMILGSVTGRTILRWDGPLGDPFDPENGMFLGLGTLDPATMQTVPTNVASDGELFYPPNSDAISVADRGDMTAGRLCIYVGQNNAAVPEFFASAGPGLVWADLVRVAEVVPGAGTTGTLRLEDHTLSYHTLTNGGGGGPQIQVTAVNAVERVLIRDITIDGQNLATGFVFRLATILSFERVAFRNLAHSGVYKQWCRDIEYNRCKLDGGCTTLYFSDATGDVRNINPYSRDGGDRECAVGRCWGFYCLINDSAEHTEIGANLKHASTGPMLFGYRNLYRANWRYRDLDNTVFKARNLAAADDFTLSFSGVGCHRGVVSLNIACFDQGDVFNGGYYEDCRSPSIDFLLTDDCTDLMHDAVFMVGNTVEMVAGKSSFQDIDGKVRRMGGISTQDAAGNLIGFVGRGLTGGTLRVRSGGFRITNFITEPQASGGAFASSGILLDSAFPILELRDISTDIILYSAGFGALDYSASYIKDLRLASVYYDGILRFAQNTTAASGPFGTTREGGDLIALDITDATFLRKTVLTNNANAGARRRVVAGPGGFGAPLNGFMLISDPSQEGRLSADATAINNGMALFELGAGSVQVSPIGGGPRVAAALTPKGAVAGYVLGGAYSGP